uniref:Leucine-rich repeat-containing N-terminal plant-type domain-containing protein n=1 Tax=Fagus sylvatica TaxID=28930 RepID=A0A2N9FWZ4_FAGSY
MGLSHWSSAPPSSSFSMHAFNLLLWCGLLVTSMVSGNNETDRLALLEFKAKITLDPFGVMTSWNDSIHFCQWRGVTCGRRHQRVTVLDLRSLKLIGSISSHAKSDVPLLLRVHGLFPEIANPFAISAFLGILISELLFDSSTAPLDRSHQDLSIATKIGRIQPRTRPHAPPEVSGSPATRARAPTRRPAPPPALTRSHAPLARSLICVPRMGSTSGHEITHPITIILDGPVSYHACHIGTISSPDLTIPDTYLVPKLSLNLLSVGQLCELGLDLHFSNRGVDVQDPLTGKLLGTGRKIGHLFKLCNLQIPSHMVSSSVAATTTLSPDLWHSRLGHASLSRLQLLASQGHLGRQHFPFISSSMTLIFTNPSIDLYPDPVRDSTLPSSSSDVPSLVLSPAAGSPNSDLAPSELSESPTDIRRSTRVKAPPSHLSDYHCYFALATLHEPHTYREASTNPLWQQAMADELDALHKTHTWDMTTLPPSKGFTQEYGIDYEETFASVTRLTSVRSLLAVATVRHWPLFQMDVKNAFLNGDLLEEVYMQPPPGYLDSQNQVCHLRRALYGLKQAPRAWFAKFSYVVAQQGFTPSSYDLALFIRHTSTGITLILLYVDGMIIIGDDTAGIRDLQKFLSQHFEMKDLGTLSYFLGLETVSTPLELNVKLNTTDSEPLSDATLYRQLVGSLIYLTVTRPDLAYVVHLVSQFMSAPRSTHYATVLRILRYIKGTLFSWSSLLAQSSLELRAYADAD